VHGQRDLLFGLLFDALDRRKVVGDIGVSPRHGETREHDTASFVEADFVLA